eukprot:362196-Chlamydomonas_euryale.AAC.4
MSLVSRCRTDTPAHRFYLVCRTRWHDRSALCTFFANHASSSGRHPVPAADLVNKKCCTWQAAAPPPLRLAVEQVLLPRKRSERFINESCCQTASSWTAAW